MEVARKYLHVRFETGALEALIVRLWSRRCCSAADGCKVVMMVVVLPVIALAHPSSDLGVLGETPQVTCFLLLILDQSRSEGSGSPSSSPNSPSRSSCSQPGPLTCSKLA